MKKRRKDTKIELREGVEIVAIDSGEGGSAEKTPVNARLPFIFLILPYALALARCPGLSRTRRATRVRGMISFAQWPS